MTERRARPVKHPPVPNDPRPVIRIEPGEIETAVNEAEEALIRADRGLYQRDGRIVYVGRVQIKTLDGSEVSALRILERGDHALLEDLATSARFEKRDARAKGWVPTDPSMAIVRTLKQRAGRLRFPVLRTVVTAPTLRPDGSLLSTPGYDAGTGIFVEFGDTVFPKIARAPSRGEAQAALQTLDSLLEEFPFVAGSDRSVGLSSLLTGVVRPSLRTAPLHAASATTAGSGKSFLFDLAAVLSTGREAAVIAAGQSEEELEKRLHTLFMSAEAFVALDNVERPLAGEFLCQVLTQSRVRPRILGKSELPECETTALVTVTGNNLRLAGDLTRRAILCRLDARCERPELREFRRNPLALLKAERPKFVAAALTVLLAYDSAGRPDRPRPLASFEDWSDLVRGALMWLGRADPVLSMEEVRARDPRRSELGAVMAQWRATLSVERVSTRRLIEIATANAQGEYLQPDLRQALLAVAGRAGEINPRTLGNWLAANKGRVLDGHAFEEAGQVGGYMTWRLAEV